MLNAQVFGGRSEIFHNERYELYDRLARDPKRNLELGL